MLVLPVQSGQTRLAMRLLAELEARQRQGDARQAIQAAGLTQIAWYVSVQPTATFLIAQIDGTEPVRGFLELVMAESDEARWSRACLAEIGGVEVNARVLEQLIHSPLACIGLDPRSAAERSTPGPPGEA
jgi:hypothetical protein